MRSTLIDAGPLIALFDSSDQYHLRAVRFIEEFHGQLWSTWPAVTETLHMLRFSSRAQADCLYWISQGGVRMFEIEQPDLNRIITLIKKYDDVPMDLADASLVAASESLGIDHIATIDSDFYVYRDVRNKYLTNVFI